MPTNRITRPAGRFGMNFSIDQPIDIEFPILKRAILFHFLDDDAMAFNFKVDVHGGWRRRPTLTLFGPEVQHLFMAPALDHLVYREGVECFVRYRYPSTPGVCRARR